MKGRSSESVCHTELVMDTPPALIWRGLKKYLGAVKPADGGTFAVDSGEIAGLPGRRSAGVTACVYDMHSDSLQAKRRMWSSRSVLTGMAAPVASGAPNRQ